MDIGEEEHEGKVEEEGVMSALERLRRGENVIANIGGDDGANGPRWWHTYKYRPIMGCVVIGEASNDNGGSGLEVALVERPIWEADLPPRYYGDQEWEKPGA
jgi:U3 small nucleolar RNA-associated protein 4